MSVRNSLPLVLSLALLLAFVPACSMMVGPSPLDVDLDAPHRVIFGTGLEEHYQLATRRALYIIREQLGLNIVDPLLLPQAAAEDTATLLSGPFVIGVLKDKNVQEGARCNMGLNTPLAYVNSIPGDRVYICDLYSPLEGDDFLTALHEFLHILGGTHIGPGNILAPNIGDFGAAREAIQVRGSTWEQWKDQVKLTPDDIRSVCNVAHGGVCG